MAMATKTGSAVNFVRAQVRLVGRGGTSETGYRMGWRGAHVRAWRTSGVAAMVEALAKVADDYSAQGFGEIGTDGVLGEAWLDGARCVRGLLDGDLRGLEGGTVDGLLRDLARYVGFTEAEADSL